MELFIDIESTRGLGNAFTTEENASPQSILQNNLTVLTLILAGSVTFGGPTIISTFFSGFIHANVLVGVGVSFSQFVNYFLLHSIIELPAAWIAASVGFRVPYEFTQFLRGKKDQVLSRSDATDMLLLVIVAYVMITVSSLFEGALLLYYT